MSTSSQLAVTPARDKHLNELKNANSGLELRMKLKIEYPAVSHRATHIIATIGPNTQSVDALQKLFEVGVDIVRMNFSHGSHEFHGKTVVNAREAAAKVGRPIAIALDTKGPEIRTGRNKGATEKSDVSLDLKVGNSIVVTTDKQHEEASTADLIYVDYPNIVHVVGEGSHVYIDDGLIDLVVKSVASDHLVCEIASPGQLGSKKGVNLPGASVDLPTLSVKDISDMGFALEHNVDMIFASFIRKASDIELIRKTLGEAGKNIKIIAKIENQEGMDNFDSILEVTDGVMVARGDLGIEIPLDQVFIAQKMMIAKCNNKGKPVICATQMLESMISQPRPTRAEATDVANAVLDGSDCVMLSGETAKGKYPYECVSIMAGLCRNAEACFYRRALRSALESLLPIDVSQAEACALAAVQATESHNASAIVCLTDTGSTARLISKFRPSCPIICVAGTAQTARQLNLYSGVIPLAFEGALHPTDWLENINSHIAQAVKYAKEAKIVETGDSIVCVHGWRSGPGSTNTIRILTVE